jgi:putative Ca2+/H+ antiporter (TMEM165/GDT1 family)
VSNFALFFYVFGIIFVAELPDKTALAALVLATRNKPAPVFVGTALALAVQSAVAVAAGRLFSLLPPRPVHVVAGIVFIGSAIAMWRQKDEGGDDSKGDDPSKPRPAPTFLRTAATSFGVVFLAEWGDITQIGTAALAAKFNAPVIIFFAATFALCGAAAVAVFVGNRAARFLNPAIVQKVAAVLFALVGLALILNLV